MYYCVQPLAVPLVYFLYSRGCGRHGLAVIVLRVAVMDFFGGPLSFVAVIAVAVMVCGRHGIDPSVSCLCSLNSLMRKVNTRQTACMCALLVTNQKHVGL